MHRMFPCCGSGNEGVNDSIDRLYRQPVPEFHSLDTGLNSSTNETESRPPRALPIPPSASNPPHVFNRPKRTNKYSVTSYAPHRHSSPSIPPSKIRRHGQRSRAPSRMKSPTQYSSTVGSYDVQVDFEGLGRNIAEKVERTESDVGLDRRWYRQEKLTKEEWERLREERWRKEEELRRLTSKPFSVSRREHTKASQTIESLTESFGMVNPSCDVKMFDPFTDTEKVESFSTKYLSHDTVYDTSGPDFVARVNASILSARISIYKERRKLARDEKSRKVVSRIIRKLKADLRTMMSGKMDISSDSESDSEEEIRCCANKDFRERRSLGSRNDEKFRRERSVEAVLGKGFLENSSVNEVKPVGAKINRVSQSMQLVANDREGAVGRSYTVTEFEKLRPQIGTKFRPNDDREQARPNLKRNCSIGHSGVITHAESSESKVQSRIWNEPFEEALVEDMKKIYVQPEESDSLSEIEGSFGETELERIRAKIRANLKARQELKNARDVNKKTEKDGRRPNHVELPKESGSAFGLMTEIHQNEPSAKYSGKMKERQKKIEGDKSNVTDLDQIQKQNMVKSNTRKRPDEKYIAKKQPEFQRYESKNGKETESEPLIEIDVRKSTERASGQTQKTSGTSQISSNKPTKEVLEKISTGKAVGQIKRKGMHLAEIENEEDKNKIVSQKVANIERKSTQEDLRRDRKESMILQENHGSSKKPLNQSARYQKYPVNGEDLKVEDYGVRARSSRLGKKAPQNQKVTYVEVSKDTYESQKCGGQKIEVKSQNESIEDDRSSSGTGDIKGQKSSSGGNVKQKKRNKKRRRKKRKNNKKKEQDMNKMKTKETATRDKGSNVQEEGILTKPKKTKFSFKQLRHVFRSRSRRLRARRSKRRDGEPHSVEIEDQTSETSTTNVEHVAADEKKSKDKEKGKPKDRSKHTNEEIEKENAEGAQEEGARPSESRCGEAYSSDGTKKTKGLKHKFENIEARFMSRNRSRGGNDRSDEDADDSDEYEASEQSTRENSDNTPTRRGRYLSPLPRRDISHFIASRILKQNEEGGKTNKDEEDTEEKSEKIKSQSSKNKFKHFKKMLSSRKRSSRRDNSDESEDEEDQENGHKSRESAGGKNSRGVGSDAAASGGGSGKIDEEAKSEPTKKGEKKDKRKNHQLIGEKVELDLSKSVEKEESSRKGIRQRLNDLKYSMSSKGSFRLGSRSHEADQPRPESAQSSNDTFHIPEVRRSRFRLRLKSGRSLDKFERSMREYEKSEKKLEKKRKKAQKKEEKRKRKEEKDRLYGPRKSFFSWRKGKKKSPAPETSVPNPQQAAPNRHWVAPQNTDWESSSLSSFTSEKSWQRRIREHNRQLIFQEATKDQGSSRDGDRISGAVIKEYSRDTEQGPSRHNMFDQLIHRQSLESVDLMNTPINSEGICNDSSVMVSPQPPRLMVAVSNPISEANASKPIMLHVPVQPVATQARFADAPVDRFASAPRVGLPTATQAGLAAAQQTGLSATPQAGLAVAPHVVLAAAPHADLAAAPHADLAAATQPSFYYLDSDEEKFFADLDIKLFGAPQPSSLGLRPGASAPKPTKSQRTAEARTSTSPCFDPPWTPTPPSSPKQTRERTARQREAEEIDEMYRELIAELDAIDGK